MAGQETTAKLNFEEFNRYYVNRRYRKTGERPQARTLALKATYLGTAARFAGSSEEVGFGKVLSSRPAVENLLDKLSARVTSGTMRNVVYALRDYGNFAVAQGWIPNHVILPDDVPPKNPPKPISVYSAAEVAVLVAAARGRGLRWWAYLATVADTGRRAGEVLSFRWDQLRQEGDAAYFELPTNKTREPQYVPLPRRLREEVFTPANIAALKAEPTGYHGGEFNRSALEYPFPGTYNVARARFERLCKVTGVPYRGLHTLRHTLITQRIAAGVPIQAVASLAGHSSPAITMSRYSHATSLDYLKYVDPEPAGAKHDEPPALYALP